jgi:hypothetical protein
MTPEEIWRNKTWDPNLFVKTAPSHEELVWLLWWASREELSTPGWPDVMDVFEAIREALERCPTPTVDVSLDSIVDDV